MLTPPFKRSAAGLLSIDAPGAASPADAPAAPALRARAPCCDGHAATQAPKASVTARTRLHELDTHLHCSIIGNCLAPGDLRRLLARHVDVKGASDLDVHTLAVNLAVQGGEVAKALHKALDQRHAGALRQFAAAAGEASLDRAWQQAWGQGDIPGAYWALVTHKAVTPALLQRVFGEVHMLSHLMGAANRHELKRFVALEKENAELHERLDREAGRRQEALRERDELAERLRQQGIAFEGRLAQARPRETPATDPATADLVALQTQRRERAELLAEGTQQQLRQLEAQLERLLAERHQLVDELGVAESELQQLSAGDDGPGPGTKPPAWTTRLAACRVLYVGGRPSSTPAIRDFVTRHGGEFLHHDGGLESRKGLLAAMLPRADVVIFPVDCVDHDSATHLKRLAERHEVPFVPLRSASLASFAAGLQRHLQPASPQALPRTDTPRFCLKHG